jgi:hypothetical protein
MNSKNIEDKSKAKKYRKTLHLVNNNMGKKWSAKSLVAAMKQMNSCWWKQSMPLTSQVLIWKHNVHVIETQKVWFFVKATKSNLLYLDWQKCALVFIILCIVGVGNINS